MHQQEAKSAQERVARRAITADSCREDEERTLPRGTSLVMGNTEKDGATYSQTIGLAGPSKINTPQKA